jgi:hypothetical protein
MRDIREHIAGILDLATPIGLPEMDRVSLQNRIDKKYVLHMARLPELLEQVVKDYFVLQIGTNRIFTYKTIYYDTPDFQFFRDHHNGLTNRIKVRCRQYLETRDIFFEIKRKYQGTRTDKYRKSIEKFLTSPGEEEYAQIRARYSKHDVQNLCITLQNMFYRITLVSKKMNERATIDFFISFSNEKKEVALSDIAIIEVKQGKYDDKSAIVQLLKRNRIFPGSISKYSYGLLMLEKGVKYNAFKPIMTKVAKIQNNGITGYSA